MDTVRVLRVIEYVGPRAWVEMTIQRSIHGELQVPDERYGKGVIRVATLGTYPEILNPEAPSSAHHTEDT